MDIQHRDIPSEVSINLHILYKKQDVRMIICFNQRQYIKLDLSPCGEH